MSTGSHVNSGMFYTVKRKASSLVEQPEQESLTNPSYNEDTIEACGCEINGLKYAVAEQEVVGTSSIGDFPDKIFKIGSKEIGDELTLAKEKLRDLYDLYLLHLRASVMDYQRHARNCACTLGEKEEIHERILELRDKIDFIFIAKSNLSNL